MCFQESETQKRTSSASLLQLAPFEVQITGTFWTQIDNWLNRWAELARTGHVSFADEFDESGWCDEDDLYPSWDDLNAK